MGLPLEAWDIGYRGQERSWDGAMGWDYHKQVAVEVLGKNSVMEFV